MLQVLLVNVANENCEAMQLKDYEDHLWYYYFFFPSLLLLFQQFCRRCTPMLRHTNIHIMHLITIHILDLRMQRDPR